MTANDIIREIEALPPNEQASVVRFAWRIGIRRKLSPQALGDLAGQLAGRQTTRMPLPCARKSFRAFTAANLMPKICRHGLPPALLEHLLLRIRERSVPANELE